MTVRHYFKTWRSVQGLWKFLQVQLQKPSSAMMKLALMRTATGKEDPELPLLQRISSLRVTSLRNCSPNKCFRVQVTDTFQHELFRGDCESGLHGWIAAKKPLLKDINNNKKREITSLRSVNWKISKTLKVSSSAVTKTIKLYDETGSHEDHHWKGRPRVTSAAEDTFVRVSITSDCSPNKCFTELK